MDFNGSAAYSEKIRQRFHSAAGQINKMLSENMSEGQLCYTKVYSPTWIRKLFKFYNCDRLHDCSYNRVIDHILQY